MSKSGDSGLVNGGKELIEWSEQDGWAHFYLYDGTGKLKNQITSGPFHCEDIVGIDDERNAYSISPQMAANREKTPITCIL